MGKMNEYTSMNTQERIAEILPQINDLAQSRYGAGFPENCKEEIVVSYGKKFAKLVAESKDKSRKSSFGFVDLETGDILKAAGWATPAKGVRGNIFDSEFLKAFTPYGVVYNRG